MAHLLMIESWLLSSGLLLPQAIRKLGHRYTLLCREPERYRNFRLTQGDHPTAALADRIEVCDTNDIDALLERAEKLHTLNAFDGVLTSCDYYLWQVARVAERLGLPGTPAAAIKVANSKAMMREAMRRAGLPGPAFAQVHTEEEALAAARQTGYPLVIKPTDLCGSLFVRLVRNDEELSSAFRSIANCTVNARGQARSSSALLEAVLSGPEYSVESVTVAGTTTFIGVTDKSLCGAPYFVESGHMFPARLKPDAESEVTACVRNALAAVGYDHGMAHTEIKITEQGPRIVEINTRVGGNWISELVRRVRGVDLFEIAVRLALGEGIDLQACSGTTDSAAIQFILPEREGVLSGVEGWERLKHHPHVVDCVLRPDIVGKRVHPAQSNDDYLGYVMCIGEPGATARQIAERLLAGVQLRYAEPAGAADTRP